MKTLVPIILALITWAILYHSMFLLTEKMMEYPSQYCKVNTHTFGDFQYCTKLVAISGYIVILIPFGFASGTYFLTKNILKKELEVKLLGIN